jgi:hypothetical protein
MALSKTVAMTCLVVLLCCAIQAGALTGSADSGSFSLNTRWTSAVPDQEDLPAMSRLTGCYPNPFNPVTNIRFELGDRTAVDLRIYDLQGRLVRILAAGEILPAGRYESTWDGTDERGAQAAAGVYLYRLVTDDYSGSQRMTMVK